MLIRPAQRRRYRSLSGLSTQIGSSCFAAQPLSQHIAPGTATIGTALLQSAEGNLDKARVLSSVADTLSRKSRFLDAHRRLKTVGGDLQQSFSDLDQVGDLLEQLDLERRQFSEPDLSGERYDCLTTLFSKSYMAVVNLE